MKIIEKCKVFVVASIVLVACEKKDQVLLPSPNTGVIKAKTQAQVNLNMPGDTPKREEPYSPRFSVTAGKYTADIEVKLYSKLDDNATIFYTMDGSTPTVNSLEYVKPIKIIGNGTAVQVRAIALYDSEYWMWPSGEVEKGESGIEDWSKVSASYYVIDYSHNPEDYDNSLSLNQVKSNVLGTWVGHVTTPWVEPYNVEFKFYSNGTYSSHAISSSNHINTGGEHWWPTLYYGTDDNSNIKLRNHQY